MSKYFFEVVLACWLFANILHAADPTRPFGELKELTGYIVKWQDEFTGDKLDTKKWDYRTDSKMWSTQRPENVSVKDGNLVLTLRKERDEKNNKDYSGAGVISKQAFKYGYYEARFKCPPGKGWHSSFWMQNHNGSGGTKPDTAQQEIDVCEQDSINKLGYGANVHQWKPIHKSFGPGGIKTPDLSADFHVWGCEFTSEKITFYFEGKQVGQIDATKFDHNDQHIWLTSIASNLGKTDKVDDDALPSEVQYDYVRFFEKTAETVKP